MERPKRPAGRELHYQQQTMERTYEIVVNSIPESNKGERFTVIFLRLKVVPSEITTFH